MRSKVSNALLMISLTNCSLSLSLISPSQATIRTNQFTTKLPKICQPDLDYSAPEVSAPLIMTQFTNCSFCPSIDDAILWQVQCQATCSPQSDMFSLGLVICALYNDGHSPLEAQLNLQQYARQLEHVKKLITIDCVIIVYNLD